MHWGKLSLSIVLLAASAAPADSPPSPSTNPTTQPTAEASEVRREWFALADADPDARSAARDALMSLSPESLETLRRIVQEQPILPQQAAMLKEIVSHVFLRGDAYAADPQVGWLGVRMLLARGGPMIVLPPTDPAEGNSQTAAPTGVWISERFPGFVGYRTLAEGDVIVAVDADASIAIRDSNDFTWVIRQIGPNRELVLRVLRGGRLLRIPVKLDKRPLTAEDVVEPFLARRRAAAEAYWRDHFADVVKPKTG